MPRIPSVRRMLTPPLLTYALIGGATILAGCGTPPELRNPIDTALPPPTPTTALPSTGVPTTTPAPPDTPASPTPGDAVAVTCQGEPSAAQVVALLRDGPLPRDVGTAVTTGPLCAGDWHYTMLTVIGHEALQVISRRDNGTLRLVTAGTDVCTIEVRAAAPSGIRTLACDSALPPLPPA